MAQLFSTCMIKFSSFKKKKFKSEHFVYTKKVRFNKAKIYTGLHYLQRSYITVAALFSLQNDHRISICTHFRDGSWHE